MVATMSSLVAHVNDLVDELKNINLTILKGRLERGNILNRIKNEKAYVGYDSWCETFHQFLECINLNRETARQDMEVYKEFSYYLLEKHREELLQTSYERLVRLLPIVRKEPNMKKSLVDMAHRSNRADFDNNIRELKGKIPTDQCDCNETITLVICVKCGLKVKK